MSTGVIHTDRRRLHILAWLVEGRFPDVEECVNVGPGIHETRPLFLRMYKHTELRRHTDEIRHALLLLDAGAIARHALVRNAIAAKVSGGTADADEIAIDAFPSPATLDNTWDPPP